jgi:hypothetical protein
LGQLAANNRATRTSIGQLISKRSSDQGPSSRRLRGPVATGRSGSVPMQRVSTLPARRRWPLDEEGSALARIGGGMRGDGSDEEGRARSCGPRAQEARLSLTLISLALDEVDATRGA